MEGFMEIFIDIIAIMCYEMLTRQPIGGSMR